MESLMIMRQDHNIYVMANPLNYHVKYFIDYVFVKYKWSVILFDFGLCHYNPILQMKIEPKKKKKGLGKMSCKNKHM